MKCLRVQSHSCLLHPCVFFQSMLLAPLSWCRKAADERINITNKNLPRVKQSAFVKIADFELNYTPSCNFITICKQPGCALKTLNLPLESKAHCQEQAESTHTLGVVHGHLAFQNSRIPTAKVKLSWVDDWDNDSTMIRCGSCENSFHKEFEGSVYWNNRLI